MRELRCYEPSETTPAQIKMVSRFQSPQKGSRVPIDLALSDDGSLVGKGAEEQKYEAVTQAPG